MAKQFSPFETVKVAAPPRGRHDMSHNVMTTCDMGELIPICCVETLPGDNFVIGCNSLTRFAPLIAPVMNRFDISMHYFFVPLRILNEGFYDWLYGNNTNAAPRCTYDNSWYNNYPLANYFNLPQTAVQTVISPYPLAAYQAIYNEYYRDENLIPEVNYKVVDGYNDDNRATLFTLRKRAWKKDLFTSALPWAQKGGAVDIPLGVITDNAQIHRSSADGLDLQYQTNVGGEFGLAQDQLASGMSNNRLYAATAGLSVGATTIEDLRIAMMTQAWLEKNARAGTRPNEGNYAHFGVKTLDARLNRPEYITGITQPVTISEVLNTTGEDGGLPQGNMAGRGLAYTEGKYGTYYCQEHGFIMGIMSVMPQANYFQGIPRFFGQRFDKDDYYWSDFARLGEQEIKVKEIYAATGDLEETFGYNMRYYEYMQMPNYITGDMRSSLNFWTMARNFSSKPSLNQDFIECNPGKSIFAVQGSEDSLYIQVYNALSAIRPVGRNVVPATF